MPEVTKPVPIDESSDVVHDDTTGGTDGNPHTLSAELDDTGVLRAGQLPDLAVTNTSTVTAQSDLTSLAAEQGDVAIVTDDSQAYILTTDDPTVLGNWVVIKSPPAPVDDVFGRTGSVSPQSGDYSASEIANFASSALSAIDAEISAAATSVSGLDNATNTHISAGNPHSGSADTNHGNEAHAESYTTASEAAAAAPIQSVNGSTGDVSVAGADPIGLNESEFQSFVNDAGKIGAAASEPVTMGAIASSSPAMETVAASSTAMDAVAASQTALDAVTSSQVALDIVSALNMAVGKFVVGFAGLTPSNFADMDAVAASSTAMDAVAASQFAMDVVTGSQTAMDAVTGSQTAMNSVAASETALDSVAASQIATSSVAASPTAVGAIEGASSSGGNSVPITNNASIYVAELRAGGGGGGDSEGLEQGSGGNGGDTSFHQSVAEGGGGGGQFGGFGGDGDGTVGSPDEPISINTGAGGNGGSGDDGGGDGGAGGTVKALIANPDRESLTLSVGGGGSGGGNRGSSGQGGSATIFTPNTFS